MAVLPARMRFLSEKSRPVILIPIPYIGDSQYDYQAASRANLAFIFASEWTEFGEWQSYCSTHKIPVIAKACDLARNEQRLNCE